MKVTFFSNFLNHHQLSFCLAMEEKLGKDFIFVATQPFEGSGVSKGYEDMNARYSFCLCSYLDTAHQQQAMQLALESDVMVFGSAPADYWLARMKKANSAQLTFRYSERLFKPYTGKTTFFTPWVLSERYRNVLYRNKPYFLLAIGSYAAWDYHRLWMPKNKMFSWGYFPEKSQKSMAELLALKCQNKVPHILWAGRMLAWKHPEDLATALLHLAEKHEFLCEFIGEGEQLAVVKRICDTPILRGKVTFSGALPHNEVRTHMENSDIFALTSDYNEGWGAVLNEAMASGCACVASHATGAATSLLVHNKNGLVYHSGNVAELQNMIGSLLDNQQHRECLADNARNTIEQVWNGKTAAENLLLLCEVLRHQQCGTLIGPGEKITVIAQEKVYDHLVQTK